MEKEMNRRGFLKKSIYGLGLAIAASSILGGCMSKIGKTAEDKKAGKPFRCTQCGYLTRSDKDLTKERCPRCFTKNFKEISEAEMTEYLSEEKE
jgi:phage FluMu protein Com